LKLYHRDRVIGILEQLGYEVVNPNSDAPVYYLQHKGSGDIVLIDKHPEKFPEDYIEEKIKPSIMNFDVFKHLYEQSKVGKKQHMKRKDNWPG